MSDAPVVEVRGGVDASVWTDLAVVVAFAAMALAAGAATLRRRTA